MLRNSLLLILCLCIGKGLFAQSLIIDRDAFSHNKASVIISGFEYSGGTGIGIWAGIRGLNNSISPEISLDRFTAQAIWKNNVGSEFTLSNSVVKLFGDFIDISGFKGGPFFMRYNAPSLRSNAWTAGKYEIDMVYEGGGSPLKGRISPYSSKLNIEVIPFIENLPSSSSIDLRVNDFAFFRNSGLSHRINLHYLSTLQLDYWIKGATDAFAFKNGDNGVEIPIKQLNRVKTAISPARDGLPPFFQALAVTTQLALKRTAVPIGNTSEVVFDVRILPEDLKASFINKGIYTNSLQLDVFSANPALSSQSVSKRFNLSITIDDLAELTIKQNNICLLLATIQDYQDGVYVDIPDHLTVSKTTPFDITVRATNANFVSGSGTIPVDVLEVGPASGETQVNRINTVSIIDQKIVSSSLPVIDKSYGIRYRIPKSEALKLITSKKGTYSANLVYTLTAH